MLLPYIGIFFWSMIKFLFAPATSRLIEGNHIVLTYLVCVTGAMTGASICYYLSVYVINLTQARRARKGIKKKVFTKKNKIIIRTKNSLGIVGLALLTASFISIPLGTIITAKFYRHKKGAILYIFGAIIIVGFFTTLISYSL